MTREGDNWLAEVPDLAGAHAFARTLTVLRTELADAVILAADLPNDAAPDIRLEVDPDASDTPHWTGHGRRSSWPTSAANWTVATGELTARTAQETLRLSKAGWSVRDIAGALDIFQWSSLATGPGTTEGVAAFVLATPGI